MGWGGGTSNAYRIVMGNFLEKPPLERQRKW
jgi:hypothetical protein